MDYSSLFKQMPKYIHIKEKQAQTFTNNAFSGTESVIALLPYLLVTYKTHRHCSHQMRSHHLNTSILWKHNTRTEIQFLTHAIQNVALTQFTFSTMCLLADTSSFLEYDYIHDEFNEIHTNE